MRLEVQDLGVELDGIDGGLADGLGEELPGKVFVADGCTEEADTIHDFDVLAVGVDGVVVERGLNVLHDTAGVLFADGGEGGVGAARQHGTSLERVGVQAEGLGKTLELLKEEEQILEGDAGRVVANKGKEVSDAAEAVVTEVAIEEALLGTFPTCSQGARVPHGERWRQRWTRGDSPG